MHYKTKLLSKAVWLPIILSLCLASIVIASYILAGWLMKPVGDDYGWLYLYHSNLDWWNAFTTNLQTENGRYAQNILVAIPYGLFGKSFLKLTAIMSVGLFLAALFFSLRLLQKTLGLPPNKRVSWAGALIMFLAYTMLSISYPWVLGPIDNTFQGLLWYPGFVTYTLPLMTLILLLSLLPEIKKKLPFKWTFWLLILFTSIALGTFNELIPLLFFVLLGMYLLFKFILSSERISSSSFRLLWTSAHPLFVICIGLFIGVAIVYFSPASTARRELVSQSSPTSQVLVHSATMTKSYFDTYIFGSTSKIQTALLFIILTGVAVGVLAARELKVSENDRLTRFAAILLIFSSFAWVISVYICFVGIFKGYGLGDIYIVPRFEIVYNIWPCIGLLSFGFLISKFAFILREIRFSNILTFVSLAIFILMMLDVPHILSQASNRFATVAIFSQKWQQQDALIRDDALTHKATVSVPVIDIGDSYIIRCNSKDDTNWLGVDKSAYYSITKICDSKQNSEIY